jgi:hypothetical protein
MFRIKLTCLSVSVTSTSDEPSLGVLEWSKMKGSTKVGFFLLQLVDYDGSNGQW